MICVIQADLKSDIDYYTLGLWGKPVIWYVVDAALSSSCFDSVQIKTDDQYIVFLIKQYFKGISIVNSYSPQCDVIDGRAALLTSEGIRSAYTKLKCKQGLLHIDNYLGDKAEQVVVDSEINFELALAIIRKRDRKHWLKKMVLDRIQEKYEELQTAVSSPSVCLLGHSQIDQWNCDKIGKYTVKNCGINGITSREYTEYIIKKDYLNISDDIIVILIGTNDIVLPVSIQNIRDNIIQMIRMIKDLSSSPIYLVESLLINGRLDRSNDRIKELNSAVKKATDGWVHWIETSKMNDGYGHLDLRYTSDGLHLNEYGYRKLREIIEESIGEKVETL